MFYFLYWNNANMKIPNNPPMINVGINHNAEIMPCSFDHLGYYHDSMFTATQFISHV